MKRGGTCFFTGIKYDGNDIIFFVKEGIFYGVSNSGKIIIEHQEKTYMVEKEDYHICLGDALIRRDFLVFNPLS